MFNFNNIELSPTHRLGFMPAATDTQICELEKYCGYELPESYKHILQNYNGCSPAAMYFAANDELTDTPSEHVLTEFYYVGDDRSNPRNIWWQIERFGKLMGPNTIPIAEDGLQQVYYLKWLNGVPQVWFLTFVDLDKPRTRLVKEDFDKLLASLYGVLGIFPPLVEYR